MIPEIPGGNIEVPVILIGEKAADMIRETYASIPGKVSAAIERLPVQ